MDNPFKRSLLGKSPLFSRFLSASACSQLGSYIFDFSVPLYVLQRTHSPLALSETIVALYLPFFLMAPFTGYTADHGSKRSLMLFTDLGQALCMVLFLVYELVGTEALWPMLGLIFAAKTLMITFETVATFQLIPALVDSADLDRANSWFLSSQRLIQIVGPLAAGILMSGFGIRSCVIANILSFGATLYFVLKMKNLDSLIDGEHSPSGQLELSLSAVLRSFQKSVVYTWRSELFRPFICMMFIWNLSSLCTNTPTLTFYFNEWSHFSPFQYGLTMSFIGLLGIAGFLVAPYLYRQYTFSRAFNFSAVAMALFGAAACLSFGFPTGFVILYALSRFGSSVLSMGTFVLRQTNIPRSMVGGVNSSLRMFFMSAMPVSAYLQGRLLEHFGIGLSFLIGTACLMGCAWFAFRTSHAFKTHSAKPLRIHQDAA